MQTPEKGANYADGSVHLNLTRKESSISCPLPADDPATSVAIHTDGRRIITGNASGVVRVRQQRIGTLVPPKLRHFEKVHQIVFDPNGEFAVTCSDDGVATIWDLTPANLDSEHLKTLSVLHTSRKFDDKERLVQVYASELDQLFREELGKYPESFRRTEEQIAKWEK